VDYWALVIGILIIGMSGVVQLFPLFFTQILPGWVIPVVRAIHRWQSILIVLWVLIWHLYHTVIKKQLSMFNGVMSMERCAGTPLDSDILTPASCGQRVACLY
jgi:hypothetical protein